MSETQVGGNGSVHWLVNADDVSPDVEKTPLFGYKRCDPKQPRQFRQHGVDGHGEPTPAESSFVIRVKVPKGQRKLLLDQLQRGKARFHDIPDGDGEYLEFTVPIDRTDPESAHTQIQISWGNPTPWSDGLSQLSNEVKGGVSNSGAGPSGAASAAT